MYIHLLYLQYLQFQQFPQCTMLYDIVLSQLSKFHTTFFLRFSISLPDSRGKKKCRLYEHDDDGRSFQQQQQ